MTQPLYDSRYWSLLYEVLSKNDIMRPSKLWVTTILSKINLSTIVSKLLSVDPEPEIDERLDTESSQCMLVLWPLAVGRMNVDILVECFGAIVIRQAHSKQPHKEKGLDVICSMIIRSFRQTLGSSSNRKRVTEHILPHVLMKYSFFPP